MGNESPPEVAAANEPVRLIRPGDRTIVGTAIHFAAEGVELSGQNQAALRQIADLFAGKPHKIEVRGHAAACHWPAQRPRRFLGPGLWPGAGDDAVLG